MASSKYPNEWVLVNRELIALAQKNTAVICNLRPGQKAEGNPRYEWPGAGSGAPCTKGILDFARTLSQGTKILLHFQGYGYEVGTACVVVSSLVWNGEGFPRFNFARPDGFSEINGCPNFWGTFILAAARAPEGTVVFAMPDEHAQEFIRLLDVRG